MDVSFPARIDGQNFSTALINLKLGHRVARAGWNGKGMWLCLVENGYHLTLPPQMGDNISFAPFIGMKTADNKFVPWLCSQTDMLADDWELVA